MFCHKCSQPYCEEYVQAWKEVKQHDIIAMKTHKKMTENTFYHYEVDGKSVETGEIDSILKSKGIEVSQKSNFIVSKHFFIPEKICGCI